MSTVAQDSQEPPALSQHSLLDENRAAARRWKDLLFQVISMLAILLGMVVLITLIADILMDGANRLSLEFLTNYPSRRPAQAGVRAALVGSLYMMVITGLVATPLGVGAAIYLEEYARVNRLTRFIELNIANLAGVPSVIYGLLGLEIFVRAMRLERSLLAGSLTMSLLILPIIIIASREAIRAIPASIRDGAAAIGATQWQIIYKYVLPLAFPGILTSMILAFSRAIGETAPLITIGALTFVAFTPTSLLSPFTVLPIQSFNWISRPQEEFHRNAAAAIIVLLSLLLVLNALAIWLRIRFQKRLTW